MLQKNSRRDCLAASFIAPTLLLVASPAVWSADAPDDKSPSWKAVAAIRDVTNHGHLRDLKFVESTLGVSSQVAPIFPTDKFQLIEMNEKQNATRMGTDLSATLEIQLSGYKQITYRNVPYYEQAVINFSALALGACIPIADLQGTLGPPAQSKQAIVLDGPNLRDLIWYIRTSPKVLMVVAAGSGAPLDLCLKTLMIIQYALSRRN